MSIAKPHASALYAAYLPYFVDSGPCRQTSPRIEHQCAVRLSAALVRCGFTLRDEDFDEPRRIHRGRSGCRMTEDHVVGAQELEGALVRVWGVGEVYRNRTVGLPPAVLNSRWGIIYFNNCFTRTSGGAGDHIDLWNGTQYMNQVFRIGAGGNAGPADDLFSRSNRPGYYIRFFWLLA